MAIAAGTSPGWEVVEKYLADVQVTFGGISYEISGILLLENGEPQSTTREALASLMTRFLRLTEELEKKDTVMDKLPEIVIGDVGGYYKAQVTLNLGHLSTGVSVKDSALKADLVYPKWTPMKPNTYLSNEWMAKKAA